MKYCPECGYANDYDSKYCDYCGIRLEETILEDELNIDDNLFIRNIIIAIVLFGLIGVIPLSLNLVNTSSFLSYLTLFIPSLLFGLIYSSQIKQRMTDKRRLFAYGVTALISTSMMIIFNFKAIFLLIILCIAACILGEILYRIAFFIMEDF